MENNTLQFSVVLHIDKAHLLFDGVDVNGKSCWSHIVMSKEQWKDFQSKVKRA